MNCHHCGTTFFAHNFKHIYCSRTCQQKARLVRESKNIALWRHNRNEQMWRMRQQGMRWKKIADFFNMTDQTARRAVAKWKLNGQDHSNRQDDAGEAQGVGKEKRL